MGLRLRVRPRALVRWWVRAPHIALILGVAVAFVEKCELSELSELSPVCGRRFRQNGTIFLPTNCVLANVPSSGVLVSGLCSKLSKLLNQEDALSAPCLRGDNVIRHFDVTLPFATSKTSCWRALMLSRWLAADARAERTGARPSRAVVARRR
jgi:hypothetical protein